jgi:GDPmannose 4,6-dehydratase
MRRALIIGISGQDGAYLARRLLQCGHEVREFIQWTAEDLGIRLRFEGAGVDEIAVVESVSGDKAPALKASAVVVKIDPRCFRPTEVETLLGDPSKAKEIFGWVPEISARAMCREMVEEDLKAAHRHALLKQHDHDIAVSRQH